MPPGKEREKDKGRTPSAAFNTQRAEFIIHEVEDSSGICNLH